MITFDSFLALWRLGKANCQRQSAPCEDDAQSPATAAKNASFPSSSLRKLALHSLWSSDKFAPKTYTSKKTCTSKKNSENLHFKKTCTEKFAPKTCTSQFVKFWQIWHSQSQTAPAMHCFGTPSKQGLFPFPHLLLISCFWHWRMNRLNSSEFVLSMCFHIDNRILFVSWIAKIYQARAKGLNLGFFGKGSDREIDFFKKFSFSNFPIILNNLNHFEKIFFFPIFQSFFSSKNECQGRRLKHVFRSTRLWIVVKIKNIKHIKIFTSMRIQNLQTNKHFLHQF